jgi:hypothetical protein
MHFHILSAFLFQCNTVELKCILTGVIREGGAEEDMCALTGRLTGGSRNLQNEIFHDFCADEK